MNDFESNLKKAVNDWVNERVGPRHNPPAFDALRSATRASGRAGSSRWLIPLLAAAAVAAVAIGATAAVNATSTAHRVAPAIPGPVQTATPTPSSAATTSTTTGATQSPVVVELGGASVSLPPGWVARGYALYEVAGGGTIAAQQWCLTPSELPASTKPGACPLTLGTIALNAEGLVGSLPGGNPVDVDTEGGWASNPHYCTDAIYNRTGSSETTGDRPFGGRTADWRRWTLSCPDGTQHLIEQYVVASGPGFILFSDRANATVHNAMTEITTHATLPPQTSALRYMDRGYIRSIDRTSAGVQIRLDRAVSTTHGLLNQNPATYPYVIPTAIFDQAHLVVGSLGSLYTNGTSVTAAFAAPAAMAADPQGVPTLGQMVGIFAQAGRGFGQVKPAEIFNGGDPTGLVTNVVWGSWGGPKAVGTGISDYVGPKKTVSQGTEQPATVVAFNLGTCDGKLMYQAVEWYFPQHGQVFDPNRYENICTGSYVGVP